MPELAEVEYYRRRWDPGLGRKVQEVRLHPRVRDFRGLDAAEIVRGLSGSVLRGSEARGKQILFRFSGDRWLGIHLGMTGKLRVEAARRAGGRGARRNDEARGAQGRGRWPERGDTGREPWREDESEGPPQTPNPRHDHLCLEQNGQTLVFSDPRQFGRFLFHRGPEAPGWWADLPPSLLAREFTVAALEEFLRRHRRAPIKAVLMRQERFPGIGNWMADEILWRSAIHPRIAAGSIPAPMVRRLRREIRFVAREALRRIVEEERDLPGSWLVHRRWKDGTSCPRTRVPLVRETIGGRTTCWSPGRQRPRRRARRAPVRLPGDLCALAQSG